MKRKIKENLICSALLALAAVSCGKSPEGKPAGGEERESVESVKASIVSAPSFGSQRYSWASGDEIGLLPLSGEDSFTGFTLTAGAGTREGTFGGGAVSAKGGGLSGVYPFIKEGARNSLTRADKDNLYFFLNPVQKYVPNSIESGLLPMVAQGADLENLSFRCAAGILRFTIGHNRNFSLKRLELRASNHEKIAGEMYQARSESLSGRIPTGMPDTADEAVTLDFAQSVELSGNSVQVNIVLAAGISVSQMEIRIIAENGSSYEMVRHDVRITGGQVSDLGHVSLADLPQPDYSKVYVIADNSGEQVLWDELEGFDKKIEFCYTTSRITKEMLLAVCSKARDKAAHIDLDLGKVEYSGTTWPKIEEFSTLYRLGELILPSNILTIANNAFYRIPFDRIVLDEALTTITQIAFYQTGADYEVSIPRNVNSIGIANFNDARSITVSEANPFYTSSENAVYSKDMKEILCFAGKSAAKAFVVPESVEKVHSYCFESAALEEITLPAGLKNLGMRTFQNAPYMHSITFSGQVPPAMSPYQVSLYNYPGYMVDLSKHRRVIYVPEGRKQAYNTFLSQFVSGKDGVAWEIVENVEKTGAGNEASIIGLEEVLVDKF